MSVIPQPVVKAVASVARAFVPSTADKKWWQSKTLWTTALVAGAGFFPPIQAAVIAAPDVAIPVAGLVVGGVFAVLRLITGGKVTLK